MNTIGLRIGDVRVSFGVKGSAAAGVGAAGGVETGGIVEEDIVDGITGGLAAAGGATGALTGSGCLTGGFARCFSTACCTAVHLSTVFCN